MTLTQLNMLGFRNNIRKSQQVMLLNIMPHFWLVDRDKDEANDHKTVLDKAIALFEKQRVVVHLQTTFFCSFGKPIYKFLIGLQVDIVPKGCADTMRHPIAHRLYSEC